MERADVSKPAPALELPNELWIEIFRSIDNGGLLELSLVCKQFNRLIFTHMAHRFQLQLSVEQLEQELEEEYQMVPERMYKHLSLRTTWLISSNDLPDTVKQLAPNVESLKLKVDILCDQKVLLELLKLCTRLHTLSIKACSFECKKLSDTPNCVLAGVRCLQLGVILLENIEQFLPSIPNVRILEIVQPANAIPQLYAAIANGLPHVETLQVSGNEPIPLNELARMKCLKQLTIDYMGQVRHDTSSVQLPQVETFKCTENTWLCYVSVVLHRFPNLKHLSLKRCFNEVRDLQALLHATHCLKELWVVVGRLTLNKIELLQQLTNLELLSIEAFVIAKTNFRMLRKLMCLPELRTLEIKTQCDVPENVSAAVARANRTCKLILNGELVSSAERVRRAGVKRRHPNQK